MDSIIKAMASSYSYHSLGRPLRGLEPSGPKGMASFIANFDPFALLAPGPKCAASGRSHCLALNAKSSFLDKGQIV